MSEPIFVLGGAQTDFARNWSREGATPFELIGAAIDGTLQDAAIPAADVQVAHVGNFVAELFCGQGHLGGMVASARPELDGIPTARHEAACASGSVAALAAMADLEAGRYDVALVVGVEQMRNVSGRVGAEHLGAAAWAGREGQDATFLWPHMFSRLADEYEARHGLDYAHLMAIAKQAFDHARNNPRAQTRKWSFNDASFSADDEANPVVEGRMRRQDCGQITDGAAGVVLASKRYAERWAAARGESLDDVARILGWGHRTSSMLLQDKVARTRGERWVFPHLRGTLEDAWRRAELSLSDVACLEVHDCFSITEYMIVDHPRHRAAGAAGTRDRRRRDRDGRAAADQPQRWAHRRRAPGGGHRRADAPRRPTPGHRTRGRHAGPRRQSGPDPQHRRELHHDRELRRGPLSPLQTVFRDFSSSSGTLGLRSDVRGLWRRGHSR